MTTSALHDHQRTCFFATAMPAPELLSARHTWAQETVFRLKSLLLTGRRQVQNLLTPLPRFQPLNQLGEQPIIAVSSSALWNPDDTDATWLLTAGKVENLRIATRRLHNLEVPAGAVFSFWRHIGNPNFGQGYVLGREIREGCVVPTIAGGLCQLSNALYDAALRAGFAIVERHRHTRVIKGSLAEQDRDATVKWNYLDLRFRATIAFRIEIELTAETLQVRFRAAPAEKTMLPTANARNVFAPPSKLNDCYSCGNLACFKHPGQVPTRLTQAQTTFILDENWPEHAAYVQSVVGSDDAVVVPFRAGRLGLAGRYGWATAHLPQATELALPAWWRQVQLRLAARSGRNIFEQSLLLDKQVAEAAARRIPFTSTHLMVAQTLLPFLWETGALGGRTYDVLLTRLPAEVLHKRLDAAHSHHPDSATLRDFRAPAAFVAAESSALTQARHLLTPHQELADLFLHKAIRLAWVMPPAPQNRVLGSRILFPASALARKGAYEMRQLATELGLELTVAGRATEHAGFWRGVSTSLAGPDPLAGIGLVVYPAHVEHQPRLVLRALAAGIPVVATHACGLAPMPGLFLVHAGDYAALRQAVVAAMERYCSSAATSSAPAV